MRKLCCGALTGVIFLAGAAFADPMMTTTTTTTTTVYPSTIQPIASTDPSCIMLKHNESISGTFQGYHMGQILMHTNDGQDIELPSMAIFWGTEPRIMQSDLKVGQPLTVWLPRHTELRTLGMRSDQILLGDYEGVARIPHGTMANWDHWDMEAANR